jgi:acetoin utilization deacetylase AcuC-like enzyme
LVPVFYDPVFLRHFTGCHPESPDRLVAISAELESGRLNKLVHVRACELAPETRVSAVHDSGYVQTVREICSAGGGWLDSDTRLSPASYEAALRACGGACQAVDEVLSGRSPVVFCAVRPPGHHAESEQGMGFCLFNSIAVAAQYAVESKGLNRILVVDWDVHHGNGTQQIFYSRSDVAFLSIHRFPFYPGTGTLGETGTGEGLGYTVNLPTEFGTTPDVFIEKFRRALEQLAGRVKPELILVSAGFDAYWNDPIGSLGLQPEHFRELTQIVVEVSRAFAGPKIVSVLEGGYDLRGLAECTAEHLLALSEVTAT